MAFLLLVVLLIDSNSAFASASPTFKLSPNPVTIGMYRDLTVNGAAPNSDVFVYCKDPSGNEQCNGLNFGKTDSNGNFLEREIVKSNFALGKWCAYASIGSKNGPLTNVDCYNVISAAGGTGGSGSFSLNVPSTTISIAQGTSSTLTITASPSTFNLPITLSISNLPSGVTATFSQNSINPAQSGSSVLIISVQNNVAAGSYIFNVIGTANGITQTQQVQLIVSSANNNFVLNVLPSSISITQGSSNTISVSASPATFNQPITLSVSNLPAGVGNSFSLNPISSSQGMSSILTISSLSTVPVGNYFLNVVGASGNVVITQPLQLIVASATSSPLPTPSPSPSGTSNGATAGSGNKLLISDIAAKIDGKTTGVGSDGRINKEAVHDSSVEFKVKLKNNFTQAENLKIEGITLKVTIESIDDGNDLEQESSEFDLRAQNDKTTTLRFKVPFNVDDGTYNVIIEAEGTDENGTTQSQSQEVQLEVKKKSRELSFTNFAVNPSKLSCSKDLSINYGIINLGNKDEESASVEVKNDNLGLNIVEKDLKLDSGTDNNIFQKSARFKIDDKVQSDTYPITANVYSSDGRLRDTRTFDLTVEDCVEAKQSKETTTDEAVLLEGPIVSKSTESTKTTTETKSSSSSSPSFVESFFKSADAGKWLLIISLVFVVIFVLAAAVMYAVL